MAVSVTMSGCGIIEDVYNPKDDSSNSSHGDSMGDNGDGNQSVNDPLEDYLEGSESMEQASLPDSSQEANSDVGSLPEVSSESEPESKPKPESKPESNSEPKPESKPESSAESNPEPKPSGHIIEGVPVIAQMPKYPTGCESVSAVMAMKYWGSDITVAEFVDDYLDKGPDIYVSEGVNYGPDPYEQFVGNPRSNMSYGCYAPVIVKALKKYYDGDATVKNTTGKSLKKLCKDYIDKDIPVLTWVSIDMKQPKYTTKWIMPNGEEFQWLSKEHCMVLIGYDDEYYYFNDPYNGKTLKYDKSLVESRYSAFGKQSVVIKK